MVKQLQKKCKTINIMTNVYWTGCYLQYIPLLS